MKIPRIRFRLRFAWLSMLACGSRLPVNATETNEASQGVQVSEETTPGNEAAAPSSSTVNSVTGMVFQTSDVTSASGTDYTSGTTGDLEQPEECKTWDDQCGDGEKCLPYVSDNGGTQNAMGCFPVVTQPDETGAPCQPLVFFSGMTHSLDTCERGDFCWIEVCRPLCQGAPDSWVCPQGFGCLELLALAVCEPLCDPLEPDCAQGEVCAPGPLYFRCVPGTGDGQLFETCSDGDCAPGLYCAPHWTAVECDSNCCNSLCELDSGQCPGVGQQCLQFYPPSAPPEYDNLGACIVPQ